MSVLDQTIVFFFVTVWGNCVGLLFDCYRLCRQVWRPGYWGTSLGDIVFWLVVTVFTYFSLMLLTWGEVRFYVFLGMGLGFFIYLKFFSKTVRKFLLKVSGVIRNLLIYIFKIFNVPLKAFKKAILFPFKLLSKVINSFKPPLNPPGSSS